MKTELNSVLKKQVQTQTVIGRFYLNRETDTNK